MRKKSAPQNLYLQEDMQSELRKLQDQKDVTSHTQSAESLPIPPRGSQPSREEDPGVRAVASQNVPAKRVYQEAFNTTDNIPPTQTSQARPDPAAQHAASVFQQQYLAHLNVHLPVKAQAIHRPRERAASIPPSQQNDLHPAGHSQSTPGAQPAALPHQNDSLHAGLIPINPVNTQSTSQPAVQQAIPPLLLRQEHNSAQQISAQGDWHPPSIIQITNCHVVFNMVAPQPAPHPPQIVSHMVSAPPLQPSANQNQFPRSLPQQGVTDQAASQSQNSPAYQGNDPRAAQQPGPSQQHAAPQNGYAKAPEQTANAQQIRTTTAAPPTVTGPAVVPQVYDIGLIGHARLLFTQQSVWPNVQSLSRQLVQTVTRAIHVSQKPIPETYLKDPNHINVVVETGEGIVRERLLGVFDFVRKAINQKNTILVYYQSGKNEARAVVLALLMEFDRSGSCHLREALSRFMYRTEGEPVIHLFARYLRVLENDNGNQKPLRSQEYLMTTSLGNNNTSVAIPQPDVLQHTAPSTITGQSEPVILHTQTEDSTPALAPQNVSNLLANRAQGLQSESLHHLPPVSAQIAPPNSADPQLLMREKTSSTEETHSENESTIRARRANYYLCRSSSSSSQPSIIGSFKTNICPPSDAHPYGF